ncbi:thioesterase [Sulfitobacter sp. EhC04]|uniref:PaaI family thioesterase n=1 Tax=Sulfitobacter sp. EhC04 TaxID=1849168 RepID=UPI0007F4A6D1|nr:PaaI family thioesterase [Sulfitobacter sp. EhC04]OAN73474.1 thioesterase [Sulfitobacter sp. EhC04]
MPSPQPETSHLIENETGTQTLIGYVVDVSDPDGGARCWLDIGPQHTNRHNVLHGGIATAVIDNACGTTGSLTVDATGKAPFLTISMNVQFVAPAQAGSRVTATGRIVGGGRSTMFIAADLVDDSGRLIASGTGVFKRVPQEKLK